jgi:protein phosphatase 1 regulatory subunit 11
LKEKKKPGVKWSEDTVNNEGMGRKSSKRCCIFHKSRMFGESDSDESDSDIEAAENEPRKPGAPENYLRHHA